MRIAIDGRAVGKKVGLGTYTSNLVRGLVSLGREVEYFLYLTKDSTSQLDSRINKRTAWGSLENHTIGDFWEHFVLPYELRNQSMGVYHGTNGRLPLLKLETRYVLTVHDLIPTIFPDSCTRTFRFYMDKVTRVSARRADIVIVPSRSTKRDVVSLLGLSHEKVRVVYEGVNERFRVLKKKTCLGNLENKYGVRKGFILFVGRLEPRKNVLGLLSSFKLLMDQEHFDSQLVLVGGKTWIHEQITDSVQKKGLNGKVVFIHDADNEELPQLYNAASVFVLPSLYEGFGLPLLEAMACGIPVVASNVSSIPEVTGEAAAFVDPLDSQSITNGLKAVLLDADFREKLIQKGLERSRNFSWEKTARKTLRIYEECLGG